MQQQVITPQGNIATAVRRDDQKRSVWVSLDGGPAVRFGFQDARRRFGFDI